MLCLGSLFYFIFFTANFQLNCLNEFSITHYLCSAISTVASAMNSLAAITCEDVLQGLFKLEVPASKGAIYAKWISVFFGCLSFTLVFVVERLGGVLQVYIIFHRILT